MNFDPEWADDEQGSNVFMIQVMAIVKHPIGLLQRRWPWMLLTIVIGGIASTSAYLVAKPTYEAKSTVLVTSQQIPTEFVRSTVSGLDSLANINALMGEILSQSNLSQLIERYQLYPKERETIEFNSVITLMRSNITIQAEQAIDNGSRRGRNETSKIFSITYQSDRPVQAYKVANELAAGFIDSNIRRRSAQASTTTEFMERELNRAGTEFRQAKAAITAFQTAHRGTMPGDQETILRKLERLETRRQDLTVQLREENDRLTQVRNSEGIESNPETMLANLQLELVSQLARHTNEHPNIVALRRRIEQVKNEVGEVNSLLEDSSDSLEGSIAMISRTVNSLKVQLGEVSQQIDSLDARASEIPANSEQFEVLVQNSRILEESYLESVRKVHDAKLAEELERSQQGPRATLLDKAQRPFRPIRSPRIYLERGLAATILAALLLAFLVELMDPVVLDLDHLEAICDAPVLGNIYSV